jgi:hypothetical protein
MADVKESALSFGSGVLPSLVNALGKADDALVAHRADFVKFGQDMGKAIDGGIAELEKIDWHQVEDGIGIVRGLIGDVLDLIKMIPPQITVAFAGLVGINKLAGGLLGKGAGNILGAGIQQFIGRGSAANPMWVVTEGGFGGLGGGGAAGAATGLLGSVLKFIPAIAAATIAYDLATNVRGPQEAANKQAEGDLTNTTSAFAGGASLGDINKSLDGLNAYMNQLNNSLSPEGLAYAFNFDGVRTSLKQQRDILIGEQTYLARASAEGWGIQRTDPTKPTDLAAASIAKLGAVLVGTEAEKKHRQAIILADRKARGATSVHPNADPLVRAALTLAHQLSFLGGSHAGGKDVAVGADVTLGLTSGGGRISDVTHAINVLRADEKTLGPKDARTVAGYITRLQAELARRTKEAGDKAARAATIAGLVDSQAIRDKNLSTTVTVNPTINVSVSGQKLASAMVQWTTARKIRNS